jgi:hypothetical protein
MEHETFWSLMCSLPHWEFELFLMFIGDVVIGMVLWPRIKKWSSHHKDDDQQIEDLRRRVEELERKI